MALLYVMAIPHLRASSPPLLFNAIATNISGASPYLRIRHTITHTSSPTRR
jgi:hypothetical protein